MPVTFALLHATYRRAGGPLEVMDAWLSLADAPERVEHVFAMDADDVASVHATEGLTRVVGERVEGVTSVRNWNAAAAASTADVLVVVADDLFPPRGWDTTLTQLIEPLDPVTAEFALKVTDDPTPGDKLLRHPVVSRAFYVRHGLFSSEFDGVYCDNDITRRAFWRAVILDGRSLVFDHRHPTLDAGHPQTRSHARINDSTEYARGEQIFASIWPWRRRVVRVHLVPPHVSRRGPGVLKVWRFVVVGTAHAESLVRVGREAVRRIVRHA